MRKQFYFNVFTLVRRSTVVGKSVDIGAVKMYWGGGWSVSLECEYAWNPQQAWRRAQQRQFLHQQRNETRNAVI